MSKRIVKRALKGITISITTLCLALLLPIVSFAQGFEADVTSTVKVWEDLTGNNTLYIRVDAACNNYDMKRIFPKIGAQTAVIAKLTNDETEVTAFYEHKKFANQMLMFYDEGIWFQELDGIQAVFIPLFYCSAQHGEAMPISYIVFYDNKKYIYHFTFKCKPTVFGSCELNINKRQLAKRMHELPKPLRNAFMAYIDKVYTTREDLFPNHMTFKSDKYKRPAFEEVGTANDNSYPHILLYKAQSFLEDANLVMGSVYLSEFKELYINTDGLVDIAGFNVKGSSGENAVPQYRTQFGQDEEAFMQACIAAIDANLYEKAYWMLVAALEEFKK